MFLNKTLLCLLGIFCGGYLPVVAETGNIKVPPGQWLLDYARSHGLNVSEPVIEDAEYMLIWMRAATQVSPDLARGHLWQYDLLTRLNRFDEATAALAAYCPCVPDDLPAVLNLIDIQFEAQQTAEDRIAYCRQRLTSDNLPSEVASDLYRRLARICMQRGNTEAAAKHARQALEILPQNLSAQLLLAAVEERLDDPATRVSLALQELAANPGSAGFLWSLGNLCDTLSMPGEATKWYARAAEAIPREAPDAGVPSDLLLDTARAHLANHHYEEAISLCTKLLETDPTAASPALVLIKAARRAGRQELAQQQETALDARFRQLEADAIEQKHGMLCAQIAWFHLRVHPDPQRALKFAELAYKFLPNRPEAARILGWAYLEGDQVDKAVALLGPLAETDQWAAVGLAKAQLATGDRQAAEKTLRAAEAIHQSGLAHENITEILSDISESLVPQPDRGAVTDLLATFDARVLQFPAQTGELLDFRVNLPAGTVSFGQPIRAVLTLTNNGPYPITLGEGRMVGAQMAVSIRDTALKGPSYNDYLAISLVRRHVLMPGQKIEVRSLLDVGAAKLITDRQPQRRIEMEFTFMLDPVPGDDGRPRPALTAVAPVVVPVTRLPVDASREGLNKLAQRLRIGTESERLAAIGTISALIVERRESLHGAATYAAATLDLDRLTHLLLETLRDEGPVVRARALGGLYQLPLTEEIASAGAPLLSDSHWLVRMAAIELFGGPQGPVFLPVLDRLVEDDHPLVAELARLYRESARKTLPRQPRPPESIRP